MLGVSRLRQGSFEMHIPKQKKGTYVRLRWRGACCVSLCHGLGKRRDHSNFLACQRPFAELQRRTGSARLGDCTHPHRWRSLTTSTTRPWPCPSTKANSRPCQFMKICDKTSPRRLPRHSAASFTRRLPWLNKTQRIAMCSHSCSNTLNQRLAGKISSTYVATPSSDQAHAKNCQMDLTTALWWQTGGIFKCWFTDTVRISGR